MEAVPVRNLRGVGEAVEKKLNSLGIRNSDELLDKLPVQYVDMAVSVPLSDASDGSFCIFDAVIFSKSPPRRKGKLTVFSAQGKCEDRDIKLVWFNHPYVAKRLNIGETYTFFGKMRVYKNEAEFNNPLFELKSAESKFSGVYPVYPTKGIIGQTAFNKLAQEALQYCPESLISAETEVKYGLPTLKEAYNGVHKPTVKNNSTFVKRIALEKLAERIAAFRLAKNDVLSAKKHNYFREANYEKAIKNVGFQLTPSQTEALKKITDGMKGKFPLNAVLCGDVGSGKTVVAALSMYFAATNGYQTALAAPTEILAEQHFSFFKKAFAGMGVNIALLTGATPIAEKRKIYSACENGEIDMLIGTHAVFSDKLKFSRLSLAVADEQHRFGVAQRNSLIEKGATCDVLTLSATPIPRTMLLAAYGEAAFITVDRRTYGNIKTKVVPPEKRADMFKYLAKESLHGAKIYVIAPAISDAEGIERENCEELVNEASRYIEKDRIGLLHGKMKQAEKNEAMEKFRNGETPVLVATTVVEVGVDVPDASIIVITDADKFGLATLHQLRGRVGRNGNLSYCFLLSDGDSDRLKILTESNDGFRIAEEDFDRRGGGEIFGLEQSGSGSLKYVDAKTLKIAKEAAFNVDLERFRFKLVHLKESFSLSDVTLG